MHLLLLSDTLTTQNRHFSGVANSGKPFTYQGRRAIVDLSSLALSDKVPALLLHDRSQRVGFGTLSVKDNALLIEGKLLDNDHALSLIKDADTGFPWQMSAHVNANDSYELAKGESVTVNGQTIDYPCTILKNAVIREVSFTPTGVDSDTSAVILSENVPNDVPKSPEPSNAEPSNAKQPTPQPQEQAMPTNLNALQEENKALQEELDKLKQTIAKLTLQNKQATVSAKLSAKGYKACDKGFKGLSNSTFDLLLSADDDKLDDIIADLPSPKADSAGFLLSEQYATQSKESESNPLLADAKARQ